VQLPNGSDVRTAIEALSAEPGKAYLKELGQRSDINWQQVEAINRSWDYEREGLTPEAAIIVAVVVTILTYRAAERKLGTESSVPGLAFCLSFASNRNFFEFSAASARMIAPRPAPPLSA
jgi:hypothetical protein